MARPRSQKVIDVKEKLIRRIEHGYYLPGSRFLSNRALGLRFSISYQTADTLIRELVAEGYLTRKPGSGTFLRGETPQWRGVELIFNERARVKDSFGALLLARLKDGFEKAGIQARVRWGGSVSRVSGSSFPIFWECSEAQELIRKEERYCLLINQAPPKGLSAVYCDAVSVDDHSGGIAAGELVRSIAPDAVAMILGGPKGDQRCLDRVRGFQEAIPGAEVHFAESWFYDDGLLAARPLLEKKPKVVFCANDRLAQALMDVAGKKGRSVGLRVIGFDDAPVAEQLDLTTISIPWDELAKNVVEVAQKRISGDTSTAITRILAPRPVMRGSL
ncbi:MAG: substrate-binding domain-containing protein [Opitutaceae bacterium]|nr:substrate-binding domain-containing protein [Opitutaceae bacterium]